MADDTIDLASLLCSRLCHDLLSPIGAMNNGLELIADETDPDMRARCMDLLGESARSAAGKLKFFRLAFGAGGGFGASVDAGDARAAIEGLLALGKGTALHWHVEPGPLPKRPVRLLLNCALILSEALVRGGTLRIDMEQGADGTEMVLRGEGPRVVLDPVVRATLTGQMAAHEIDSRTAVPWMVRDMAVRGGGDVQVAEDDGVLLIGATIRGQG